MDVLKIMIVMLVLIMSLGVVCAADNVSDVAISDDGQDTLQITQDEIRWRNKKCRYGFGVNQGLYLQQCN